MCRLKHDEPHGGDISEAWQAPSQGLCAGFAIMAAPGFAVAAAPGRGLRFGAVCAGQGLAGFKVSNPAGGDVEAKKIIDNTRTKTRPNWWQRWGK